MIPFRRMGLLPPRKTLLMPLPLCAMTAVKLTQNVTYSREFHSQRRPSPIRATANIDTGFPCLVSITVFMSLRSSVHTMLVTRSYPRRRIGNVTFVHTIVPGQRSSPSLLTCSMNCTDVRIVPMRLIGMTISRDTLTMPLVRRRGNEGSRL